MTSSPPRYCSASPLQRSLIHTSIGMAKSMAKAGFETPEASARAEPARDPRHRLAHVVGRARVGEADELPAMEGIEVDPRGRGDMRLLQHLFGKLEAVRGE